MNIAAEIAKMVGEQPPRSSTHRATVLRTDNDGTTWVSIPGGADETPLHGTLVECAPGDVVDVTIANGRATATANATSPAATGRTVGVVKETAETAQLTADDAAEAAASAIEDATLARTAAARAQASAQDAETAAGAASIAADNAQVAANAATFALSDVEKVVGTLEWIAEHGEYQLTTDTAVVAGKVYYTRSGTDPNYVYTVVAEPRTADIATYYELHMDESVQNFIASHLWLDAYGLNLSVDSSNGYRIHQGTVDGTKSMGTYILDPSGAVVASFGADGAVVGMAGTSRVEILPMRTTFFNRSGSPVGRIAQEAVETSSAASPSAFDQHNTDLGGDYYVASQNLHTTTWRRSIVDYSQGAFKVKLYMLLLGADSWPEVTFSFTEPGTQTKTLETGLTEYGNVELQVSLTGGYNGNDTLIVTSKAISGTLNHYVLSAKITGTLIADVPSVFFGDYKEGGDLGNYSFATGFQTEASGECSNAEGRYSLASANGSHAEGYGLSATNKPTATGSGSHAEGYGSVTASAYGAHAEGGGTVASGAYSHAQNHGTKAASADQTALGKYNVEDANDQYAVIIGNGTSDSARSNALTVGWDGSVDAAGDVSAGGTLDVGGNAALGGMLNVAGNASIDGIADVGGTLSVADDTTMGGALDLTTDDKHISMHDSRLDASYGGVPSTGANVTRVVRMMDSDDRQVSRLLLRQAADGRRMASFESHGYDANGNDVWNRLGSIVTANGERTYDVGDPVAFCEVLHVGDYVTDSASSVSTATSAYADLFDFTLAAGTWMVFATFEFATNTTGRRVAMLNTTSGGTGISLQWRATEHPPTGGPCRAKLAGVLRPSASTKYYLTSWQNSGGALNVSAVVQAVRVR